MQEQVFIVFINLFQIKVENNATVYTCPRGKEECDADRVHACAIAHISNPASILKFVNCSLVEGFKNKSVPIETVIISYIYSFTACILNILQKLHYYKFISKVPINVLNHFLSMFEFVKVVEVPCLNILQFISDLELKA